MDRFSKPRSEEDVKKEIAIEPLGAAVADETILEEIQLSRRLMILRNIEGSGSLVMSKKSMYL